MMSKGRKIFWIFITTVILGLMALIYFKYFFVFGEGVKSGHLNYAVRKGNFFKTYEGKLIQQGFKGSFQSYEFEFSVKTRKIYDVLAANSGKMFDLHYKEYHGIVPWRGNTVFIADSIVSMKDE